MEKEKTSKIRVRLVWRLVLCLFGHLTLLLILAIYFELSLNGVRSYTPVVRAEETQLESVDTVPALLAAMDAERHEYQMGPDARLLPLYQQSAQKVQANLELLQRQFLMPSPEENERRALVRQWLSAIGTDLAQEPAAGSIGAELRNKQSRALLDRLDVVTGQVGNQVRTALLNLQQEEEGDAGHDVSLMWIWVGSVMVFTILIQLGLAQTIIAPIQILQKAVRRLQAGDYTARAHLRSGDEVQNLGETFNAMAESILHAQQELQEKNGRLSAQQEALRQANASLEERVAEKTRELEEKNRSLKEAAQLKDEFLATLSHELRTPLTPVITCAHLLSADAPLSPEHLKSVHVIERNARALSRMIDELLDLSAVMNRKLSLIPERTELNEWVRATLETVRPAWERKNLSLNFVPSRHPVELEIDPARLAQVLTNLVNNAVKFTEPGGRIEVGLTALKRETRIVVTDTGAGLNRSEIDRIFEIFHQGRTERTQGVGGLGVGLSVARSLAQLHGGGLRAESPGPGKGATFTIWLPPSETGMFDFSSAGPSPSASVAERAILRGRRLLLVEDGTDSREALQRLLERRGCLVTAAASGEQALELAQLDHPEIIISDIGLPGISGLELIIQLRTVPELRQSVAVALSGLGRDRDIAEALAAGFDAHLLKPVEIALLDQTLIELLRSKGRDGTPCHPTMGCRGVPTLPQR